MCHYVVPLWTHILSFEWALFFLSIPHTKKKKNEMSTWHSCSFVSNNKTVNLSKVSILLTSYSFSTHYSVSDWICWVTLMQWLWYIYQYLPYKHPTYYTCLIFLIASRMCIILSVASPNCVLMSHTHSARVSAHWCMLINSVIWI